MPLRDEMKVPNAERAVVDIRKLTDYCLSHEHPRGKHKARVFLSALGMTTADAGEFRDALLQKVIFEDCTIGTVDEYGTRYIVDFSYARGDRQAMVRSTWIIKASEDTPHLTSCFVL
jgi:hypothetical protein